MIETKMIETKTTPIFLYVLLLMTLLLVSCRTDTGDEQPTSEPLVSEPSATPEVATEERATEESATELPATEEPTAQPSVTEALATERPPTENPPPSPTNEPVAELAIVNVRFVESAPKDSFIIENSSGCEIGEATVVIDLVDSVGKLIFDTTGSGAGVEVFQPFEVVEGEIELVSSPTVSDGDTELSVRFARLLPNAQVGFTIDVDDTLPNSELGMIQVTDSEISGGVVRVTQRSQQPVTATFGDDSEATLSLPCVDSY